MVKEQIATLRALGRMCEEVKARGDLVMAMKLLEQAAKECGDIYSTRKQGSDAGKNEPATRVEVEFVPAPHNDA